jgi:hypothetical protein
LHESQAAIVNVNEGFTGMPVDEVPVKREFFLCGKYP